jgi:hypothetical protein
MALCIGALTEEVMLRPGQELEGFLKQDTEASMYLVAVTKSTD